jgi:hypothetical protein
MSTKPKNSTAAAPPPPTSRPAAAAAAAPGPTTPVSAELDALILQLRVGVAPGATPAQKQQATVVCRLLLAALETQPGQPLAVPIGVTAPAAAGAPPPSPPVAGAAPSPPTAPPNLLDLVTSWASAHLATHDAPHQRVPYVGGDAMAQAFQAVAASLRGRS